MTNINQAIERIKQSWNLLNFSSQQKRTHITTSSIMVAADKWLEKSFHASLVTTVIHRF